MIRNNILSIIRSNSIASIWYAKLEYLHAKILIRDGKLYDALLCLCAARRRIPDISITKKHGLLINSIVYNTTCNNQRLVSHKKNKLLMHFRKSKRFLSARSIFANEPISEKRRLRHLRISTEKGRQGNLIVLKSPNPWTGEKGVLALNYTPTLEAFVATFDCISLLKSFRVVLEPSWYRNIEASLFLLSGSDQDHVIECAHPDDSQMLQETKTSFRAIDLGSGDWIDPNVFSPSSGKHFKFDIVMVAAWATFKRHEIVFRAISSLNKQGKYLRIALVGYPADLKLSDIKEVATRHKLLNQCTFFDSIPQKQVAEILSQSVLSIHFSKAEGTNRASYESWFCNTPLIVYRNNTGFRMNYINKKTGLLASEGELASAIKYIITNRDQFAPRQWLIQRSGYVNATKKLNALLKKISESRGEPWTQDIVEKKNAPNFWYAQESDRQLMEPVYDMIERYLLS